MSEFSITMSAVHRTSKSNSNYYYVVAAFPSKDNYFLFLSFFNGSKIQLWKMALMEIHAKEMFKAIS